MLVLLAVC